MISGISPAVNDGLHYADLTESRFKIKARMFSFAKA